jgi:uncharacterized protein (DUF433 family)
MNSNEITPLKAEIIDRGRGPEIKGTRITVYAVLDYILECWHPARIAAWLNLNTDQVEAARTYLRDNTIEVLKDYVKILERSARGNPPELQAKIDAGHERFQELLKQIQEARARGEPEIQALIQKHREGQTEECADARNHGGQ